MKVTGAIFEVTFVERDGEPLVVKRPLPHLRDDAIALAILRREAGFLALARHRSVPRLVEVGTDELGLFVLEERALGVSLEALLDEHGGALPFPLAAGIVVALASSLSELHVLRDEVGPLSLVHGDPSLSNVILEKENTIRLIDFGASRFRGDSSDETRGSGTLPYAAPELVRGEVSVSRETDVYSLGAIALRLFGDAPLSKAESEAERLVEIAEHGIDLALLRAPALPPGLRTALGRLLAFDRRDRDTDTSGLLAALSPLLPETA